MSQPHMDMERLNALLRAFNDHDAEGIAEAFAEDGVFLLAAGPSPDGRPSPAARPFARR